MSGNVERNGAGTSEVEQTALIAASGNSAAPCPHHEEHREWQEDHAPIPLLPDVVDSWPYRYPWHAEEEELQVGTAWYGGRFRHSKAI